MRIIRGFVLAIVATLMLLGATGSVATANPGGMGADPGIIVVADPGDPNVPPDE